MLFQCNAASALWNSWDEGMQPCYLFFQAVFEVQQGCGITMPCILGYWCCCCTCTDLSPDICSIHVITL